MHCQNRRVWWLFDDSKLTHLPLNNMAATSQVTFWNAFSWMKSFVIRFPFHWRLFPRVQFTTIQHWFRWWLGAKQPTSHYLDQCWLCSPTHISGTRGRWVEYLIMIDQDNQCIRILVEIDRKSDNHNLKFHIALPFVTVNLKNDTVANSMWCMWQKTYMDYTMTNYIIYKKHIDTVALPRQTCHYSAKTS